MRFLFLLALILSACTDSNKSEITNLLETRDLSISQQDIKTYSSLLTDDYLEGKGGRKIEEMKGIFSRFDVVEMTSRDREIRLLDDNKAICEQTYLLKVLADNEWREIVQREQLKLELSDGHWKISGGL